MDEINVKKCICTNCGSEDSWRILNDDGIIIGWCVCGHQTSVGYEVPIEVLTEKTDEFNKKYRK